MPADFVHDALCRTRCATRGWLELVPSYTDRPMSAPHRGINCGGSQIGDRVDARAALDQRGVHVRRRFPTGVTARRRFSFHRAPLLQGHREEAFVQGDSGRDRGCRRFINASTDKELTAYWARVPSEHMNLGLDVLFDIVANSNSTRPMLSASECHPRRARMYQDQPQDLVQNLFEELIWPGHPLGRDNRWGRRSQCRG